MGGVRKGDSPDTSAYLERVAANLTERAEGLEKSSGREAEAAEYRQVIRRLEQWIEEGKA